MPGGDIGAWPMVKEILQSISAKVDDEPCCQWIGPGGAGHYVKMVHNGIEYGDMQLIAEAYHLMRAGLDMSVDEIQEIFAEWNMGVLDSYLIEITANILALRDEQGAAIIDTILDAAGQKGTGKWTAINALELGIPLTLIGEAVFARCLSAIKDERLRADKLLSSSHAVLFMMPCTPPKLFPMPRVICSCVMLQLSTTGP
jgi:6-phosphogluconate dehydrogenase